MIFHSFINCFQILIFSDVEKQFRKHFLRRSVITHRSVAVKQICGAERACGRAGRHLQAYGQQPRRKMAPPRPLLPSPPLELPLRPLQSLANAIPLFLVWNRFPQVARRLTSVEGSAMALPGMSLRTPRPQRSPLAGAWRVTLMPSHIGSHDCTRLRSAGDRSRKGLRLRKWLRQSGRRTSNYHMPPRPRCRDHDPKE